MKPTNCMYLYGAGGHAKVILDILQSFGISVKGVFDDNPPNAKLRIMKVADGIRLLGALRRRRTDRSAVETN